MLPGDAAHRTCPQDSEFAQHETFGPVAAVEIVDDADEAVARANATSYGLSAGIITGDTDRGFALAQQIDSGIVHVNDQTVGDEPQMPFGGVKDSRLRALRRPGRGRRVHRAALDHGAERRAIPSRSGPAWRSSPSATRSASSSRDGDTVALEGFTHLIPHAAGHELIRQGRRDLTLVRMTPDVIYDQLIGMGCARKLVFSWGGNPGVGSLHRLRDAVEHGWPRAARARGALARGDGGRVRGRRGEPAVRRAARLPRAATCRRGRASRRSTCPFTGEELAAVPAHRPDVGIVHAQQADRHGQRAAVGDHRRAEGGRARVARARSSPSRRSSTSSSRAGRDRPAGVGRSTRSASCRAARIRRTRTATTTATTTSTSRGTRSAATATRFRAWMREHVLDADVGGTTRASAVSRVEHTSDEMMAVEASRRLDDDTVCFVGIGLPSLAANLARRTHAPDCVLVYESGTIGAKPTSCRSRSATASSRRPPTRSSRCRRCSPTGCRAGGSTSASSAPRRSTGTAT